jgi:23S rRNA pseudouridine1911/1915/1917 synthase
MIDSDMVPAPEDRIKDRTVVVLPDGQIERVDKYISDFWGVLTRSQIKHRNTQVRIDGILVKLSRKVSAGDLVEIEYSPPERMDLVPEDIPLDVIFENNDVLVINKAQGLVVHPAAGNFTGTLVQGLLYRYQEEEFEDSFGAKDVRPGIVHRLDKDTSGVLITAKNPDALEFLSGQFREKKARKRYVALVKGNPRSKEGRIDNYLVRDPRNRKKFTWRTGPGQGKHAVTDYRVVKDFDGYSLIFLYPLTGRTHQLRVHMLSLGHPILGDPVYGRNMGQGTISLMLHASRLTICLPGETSSRTFRAPLPERFLPFLERR